MSDSGAGQGGEPLLQQKEAREPQPAEDDAAPQSEGDAGLQPEEDDQAAEEEEQMRLLEAYWDSWDQYEVVNAFAVDGHPAEGYNGIYLPAGECGSWPQCVLPCLHDSPGCVQIGADVELVPLCCDAR